MLAPSGKKCTKNVGVARPAMWPPATVSVVPWATNQMSTEVLNVVSQDTLGSFSISQTRESGSRTPPIVKAITNSASKAPSKKVSLRLTVWA